MTAYDPILAPRASAPVLNLGSAKVLHLIRSADTAGKFSVVEFVAEPGEGVGVHTHANEEELVYLAAGQIEVTLGDRKMTVTEGTCAQLPRNIPHGFANTGQTVSRLLAILLPGQLDEFFVQLAAELARDRPHEAPIAALTASFGLVFAK